MTKDVFCHDKHVCHDKSKLVMTKLLLRQKLHLWQLPPTIEAVMCLWGWVLHVGVDACMCVGVRLLVRGSESGSDWNDKCYALSCNCYVFYTCM